ncbi:YqjF family protein [Hymenobacter jejuensis]|uniref:DUF2071 domain-containing protein n=1 Tax=Hymenobacter jejuensis TaxID=2502781 RepID=A0A5B7ZW03_9BACT|nr:DUF2071 domain-containing protein [Hymenobacter jejuensis]QDA59321.1 DUF2071 domain-containing protein [Hymenobacter jejuensis]
MGKVVTFLTAEWRNLLMANYEVDPQILKKYLPSRVELDDWNGTHYASLIGFLFTNTKVRGIAFPFHRTFEEVNLRFYVRYKDGNTWKRGVVFVKEIVPRIAIVLVANTLYKEKYAAMPMRYRWDSSEAGKLKVEYNWKVKGEWNFLKATADTVSQPIPAGSEAEFITEHYWGYTKMSEAVTSEYEVVHPRWNMQQVVEFEKHCNVKALYGAEFVEPLQQQPKSVFLADGSAVKVMGGGRV